MTNLKPCPFCGGEPKLMQAWVECKKCRAMTAVSGTRNDAISAWNRRPDQWIPVSERLPESPEYDWVLVQAKMIPEGWYGVPHIAELRRNVWYTDCCDGPMEETLSVKVTHWMPLPQPPVGGAE